MFESPSTPKPKVKSLEQQQSDFTSEGSPPPGKVAASEPAMPDEPVAKALESSFSQDVAMADWSELFHAIKTRLKSAASVVPAAPPGAPGNMGTAELRDVVLECVAALNNLHCTLDHELARYQSQGLQRFDAPSSAPARGHNGS